MAGIGFELRKLFSERDRAFGDLKAIAYSSIISVGPWIITSTSLMFIVYLAKRFGLEREQRVIYTSSIFYAFIFSQLLTGPFQYIVTRYISDAVFEKKVEKIRGAYIGITKVITIFGFFISYFFIKRGELSGNYKMAFVTLFICMSLSWITMIFITLLKNYNFMIITFFVSNLVAVLSAYLFLKYPLNFMNESTIFWLLLSYTIGMFINFLFTSTYLLNIFKGSNRGDFKFLSYFRGYFSLFLVGLFYFLGVWIHIIINWYVGDSYLVAGVFLISPLYEVAVFYAFCTAIPAMVYFMIFMETKFLPVYQNYYKQIFYTGTFEEVEEARSEMFKTLEKELLYCIELQFIITLTFILIANIIFDYFRLDLYLLEVFRLTTLSAFSTIFVSIFITIFLYFDSRGYALLQSFLFFLFVSIFSYIFGKMGRDYLGFGFFIGSLISFGIGHMINQRIFKELNYISMYKRNFETKVGAPIIDFIDNLLRKKLYLVVILILIFFLGGCSSYDRNGFNKVTKRNWHTMSNYSLQGYDYEGYNSSGVNSLGFNRSGWNIFTDSPYDSFGFDVQGVHKVTEKSYDERGFDREGVNVFTKSEWDSLGFNRLGIHKNTGKEYNEKGWTYYGLNIFTGTYYDRDGFNVEGVNEEGFRRDGWNIYSKSYYDGYGFNIKGVHKETKKNFDERGFNKNGYNIFTKTNYDKNGFDRNGIHKETGKNYDKDGWTFYGLNIFTNSYYNREGYTKEGLDREGYTRYNRPEELGDAPTFEEIKSQEELSNSENPNSLEKDIFIDEDGFNKDGIFVGGGF